MLLTSNEYSRKELKVIDFCHTLAHSQGLYGRLMEQLLQPENRWALRELADMDFKDIMDFIMYIEC